jgi:ATP-binding cassette subfamily B protein
MSRRSVPLRTIRRVYRAFLGLTWEAAGGRVLLLVASAVTVALSDAARGFVTKLVVDDLAAGSSRAVTMGMACIALAAASTLIDSAAAVGLQSDLGERIGQALEQRVMRISASAPGLEHLERPDFADRMKLVRDRATLPFVALTNLNGLASIAVGLASAVVLLGSIHPLLALTPVVAVPGAALQYRAWRRHYARHDDVAIQERLADHYLELATRARAAKEVRLFGLGRELLGRHRQVTDAAARRLLRDQVRTVSAGVTSGALYGAAIAGAVAFAGWLALRGQATLGDVALGVQMAHLALGQVEAATRQAALAAEISFAGERYLWLLEYRSPVLARPAHEAAPAPEEIRRDLRLEGVSFAYPGTDRVILDGVSLVVPAGATVALVGENGAGKSTLVKLLCRFYDPTEGRILVDGADLRDLDLAGWRARMGSSFQDFVRFQLLAREAVGVGDLELGEDLERVRASTRLSGADRVIERLPDGFETQLGRWFAGGVELSEGEWQRIALARGLMRPSPVLVILDEPTASLDARAEHEIFQRFARMARPVDGPAPITLLVSHRFSTVRMADLIVVLEGGRIEELGSHEELMEAGGRYAKLFNLQASRYEDPPKFVTGPPYPGPRA